MGLQITWRSFVADEDAEAGDQDVLYWFAAVPGGYEVERALKTWLGSLYSVYAVSVRSFRVNPPATPKEFGEWTRAARAYFDEVAAAMGELGSAQERLRRRRWWPARLWATAHYREAKAVWRDRVSAATAAYRPVREVIDRRLAEQAAASAEAARRKQQAESRRQQEAETRCQRWFLAWRCRQLMPDRVLPNGRTAREVAAAGEAPPEWPAEMEAVVGDVESWWAGVQAAVRNEQARAAAVEAIVEAFTATAEALEQAGRPGIAVNRRAREYVGGWPVEFTWPNMPEAPRLATPPGVPREHPWARQWPPRHWLLPHRLLVTAWPPGRIAVRQSEYRLSEIASEWIGSSHYRREAWEHWSIRDFIDGRLLPHSINYHWRWSSGAAKTCLRVCDHVDADIYVRYTQAVTRHVVDTFQALQDRTG